MEDLHLTQTTITLLANIIALTVPGLSPFFLDGIGKICYTLHHSYHAALVMIHLTKEPETLPRLPIQWQWRQLGCQWQGLSGGHRSRKMRTTSIPVALSKDYSF